MWVSQVPAGAFSRGGASFIVDSPSGGRAFDAAVELITAIGAALVPLGDRRQRIFGVDCQRLLDMIFGNALRPVAEAEGVAVVPPGARAVGRAEEDFAADVGMLQSDPDQLHQVV